MRNEPRHNGPTNKNTWEIDDLDKALTVLEGLRLYHQHGNGQNGSSAACLKYILDRYPELGKCSHEYIAEKLGITREAVTRGLNFRPTRRP
jgi:hypothetical protein